MYTEFSTYIDARITEVNATISGTTNDLVKIDADLDIDMLPENQKHNRYMLKFESYDESNDEAPVYEVNAVIELKFLIPNNDTTKYLTIIDSYVQALVKKIRATDNYESSAWGLTIKKVGARKLNEFKDGEYSPEIIIDCLVIDG
jgi:hypothetical protein